MSRRSLLQQQLDYEFFITIAQVLKEHNNEPKRGGSVIGHKVVHCKGEAAHQRLYENYFSDDPMYGPEFFKRRFIQNTNLLCYHHVIYYILYNFVIQCAGLE